MTVIVGSIAIYVPRDFKGVVSRRGGLSGTSISWSAATHRLAGLPLNQHAYTDEDEIVIHSTGMVRVCAMGEDVASRVLRGVEAARATQIESVHPLVLSQIP